MMPVNPVGARSFRVQGPCGKRAFRFPQERQDSPAAFFFDQGVAMADLVIPPQYRVRVKQRLKVLAYAEEHGLKPAAGTSPSVARRSANGAIDATPWAR
jgi:hypothetical protein